MTPITVVRALVMIGELIGDLAKTRDPERVLARLQARRVRMVEQGRDTTRIDARIGRVTRELSGQ